jgi:hypothetical protein
METGWTNQPPEDETPAMPLTSMLLGMRERGPGDTLEIAAARSRAAEARELRDEQAGSLDPDEHAAALVNRGYAPGMTSQLSARLAETLAELQAEREKIERGQRRQERIRREHDAGRISVFDIMNMPDVDEGDAARAEKLELRATSLRRQIAEASAMITPQRREAEDPLEAATRHAHRIFVEATRQRMADAAAGRAPK